MKSGSEARGGSALKPMATLAALCMSLPLPARAELQEIVVTARRQSERPEQISAGVTVVRAAAIPRPAQTVSDWLRGEAGGFVQQTAPGQGNVIVRGLKGSELLHVVDGIRLNNAFFRNAPNQYLALVDSYAIEQVELVRGPVSTWLGGDAMGGALQIVTRQPRFASGGPAYSSEGFTAYESASDTKRIRVAGEAASERVAFRGGVTYQDVGLRRTGGGERLPFTAYRAWAADAKLRIATPSDAQWLVGAQYARQPSSPRFDALTPGFGQTLPESAEQAFEPSSRLLVHARYTKPLTSAFADHLRVDLGLQHIEDDRRSRDFGSAIRDLEENSSRLATLSGELQKAFSAHRLLLGWNLDTDLVSSARTHLDLDTGGTSSASSRYPDGSRMRSAGLFATDDWQITPRLAWGYGARISRYQIELPAADRPLGVDLEFTDVTGHTSLNWEWREGIRWVANIGRGFRPPNVFDLGTLGARPGNRFNVPNAALEPEHVLSYDMGFKLERANLSGEVFVYQLDYRDRLTSTLTGELDTAGRSLVQTRNAARAQFRGIEAALHWRHEEHWRASVALNFTRGDERLEGVSAPADRVPPLNGAVRFEYRLRSGFDAGAEIWAADRQDRLSVRDRGDPRIHPDGTPGFAIASLWLDRELGEDWHLGLRLENLFDAGYREHGSGLDALGRNLLVTISYARSPAARRARDSGGSFAE